MSDQSLQKIWVRVCLMVCLFPVVYFLSFPIVHILIAREFGLFFAYDVSNVLYWPVIELYHSFPASQPLLDNWEIVVREYIL